MLTVRPGIKTAIDGVVFTDFPATKKSRLQKSKIKTLLFAFIDNEGIIQKEFVPAGQTINAAFYQAVINRLLQRIRRDRPELHRTGKWMLYHDNAPAQSAIRMRQLLAQKMVSVLGNPPYCPDLAPADFFLVPRLKAAIKGACFSDVNAIKHRATAVLRSIPQEGFAECFRKLYERCQTCVERMANILKGDKENLFVSFVLFVF